MGTDTYAMMPNLDDWKNERKLIEFLAKKLASGHLVLVLGAGISRAFGLPTWKGLVENLYEQKQENLTPEDSQDLDQAVRKFRNKHFPSETDMDEFLNCIHRALYKKAPPDFYQLFEINLDASTNDIKNQISSLQALSAISALLSITKTSSQEPLVISFNFDNILEKYLQYHGILAQPVHGNGWRESNGQIKIYHTHGFLPFFPNDSKLALTKKERSKSIVLDADEFDKVVGDYLNPNNQGFLNATRRNFPIYIGLSANDRNMRDLMEKSHVDHPNIQEQNLFCGLFITRRAAEFDSDSTWVFPFEVKEHEEAYRFLMKVCQRCGEIIAMQ